MNWYLVYLLDEKQWNGQVLVAAGYAAPYAFELRLGGVCARETVRAGAVVAAVERGLLAAYERGLLAAFGNNAHVIYSLRV